MGEVGGVPDVLYTDTRDGLRIAYAVAGSGPTLVYVRALNSHVERSFTDPWCARFYLALARSFTVVLFDARGNGLSDPAADIGLEALVEDVDAVIRDGDLTDVVLFGQGFGTPVAIAYAARHPERIVRLVLYCAYARGPEVVITDEFIETMRRMPDAAVAYMGRATYPDEDPLPSDRLARSNLAASSETAAAYFEFARSVDVTGLLTEVGVPTLVLQPERSPVVHVRLGQEVAEALDDAWLVTVPTASYNPWAHEAIEPTLKAIGEFVGLDLPVTPAPRRLAVLVTDMVESTAMRHRVGEEEARRIHQLHDSSVKDALARHGGTWVKSTGDGALASFPNVAEAVACAADIQRSLSEPEASDLGPVHIGIAYGDVVEERGDLSGTTVVLAVRLSERATPGQILVPDGVREVAWEAGLGIGSSRSLQLKGFPGRVRVHEVLWETS